MLAPNAGGEAMAPRLDATDLGLFGSLRAKLGQLHGELLEAEARASADLSSTHPAYRASALNLIQYLVTRQVDLRPVQLELGRHGLSSLGRIEGHVRAAFEQVMARLDDALQRSAEPGEGRER